MNLNINLEYLFINWIIISRIYAFAYFAAITIRLIVIITTIVAVNVDFVRKYLQFDNFM